jgi:hypothetical protein
VVAGLVRDAAERLGRDETLLDSPVERSLDDVHDLGFRPVALPLRVRVEPASQVEWQVILVVDPAPTVALRELLQVLLSFVESPLTES